MIVAFTSKGTDLNSELDSSFGRAAYFVYYNTETNEVKYTDNRANAENAHGVGPKSAQAVLEAGTELLITGNIPGNNAMNILQKEKIEIYSPTEKLSLKELYELYKMQNNK